MNITGWWFGTFFIYPIIWDIDPKSKKFLKGVSNTQ
jgi:hypothetical protein